MTFSPLSVFIPYKDHFSDKYSSLCEKDVYDFPEVEFQSDYLYVNEPRYNNGEEFIQVVLP
jgi:hypothetical protein